MNYYIFRFKDGAHISTEDDKFEQLFDVLVLKYGYPIGCEINWARYVCNAAEAKKKRVDRVVKFDKDDAEYVGDEENGVYYHVASNDGLGWYFTAVVDCEAFVENMYVDEGPYKSKGEASEAAHNVATEWCINNSVTYDD